MLKLGDDSGVLGQADINALSAFTALEYMRMDNRTLSGTVDFSQMVLAQLI